MVCLTAALVVCAAASALADVGDFLVNDDGGSSEQNHPRIAVANNGRFVIVWEDRRYDSRDIFLQRYDTGGMAIGGNIRVNDDEPGSYQSEPAVACDLSGLYSVVWKDYRSSTYPFDPDIFYQRFDSSVAPVDTNRRLTTELPDSLKETPDIALSPWGGCIVVWADYRNRNWDIYAQRISSNGTLLGSNFRVNDDAGTAQQHAPRVDVSAEGWFVVTWYDNRWGDDDVFVQRFDSVGNRLGINVQVNSGSDDARQAFPDVATDDAGHFTVVWVDWRNGTYPSNPDIYARKFTSAIVPVTSDKKVNTDGTTRAQREPSISADRRGNVAIIWSDSAASSWDIMGQMIDVSGVIQETNFQANFEGDSAQLHPDVALDGRYRYITWADKRNGNYDIFASIVKYNDPSLSATPTDLQFEMLVGSAPPASQQVVVDHVGYNPLNYTSTASHGWFSVTPSTGLTPEALTVSIAADTLSYGTYFGSIQLVDTDNGDSSVVVSVRLDVTAPELALSVDTLRFTVFAGVDENYSLSVSVSNAGGGDLSWVASDTAACLAVSPSSGGNSALVAVTVNPVSLTDGDYFVPIEFHAGDIINSPDTLWVVVQAVANQPYLLVEPDSLHLATTEPDSTEMVLVISNPGVGTLNWVCEASDTWLQLSQLSGDADDSIAITVEAAGLSYGMHTAHIEFSDSATFNQVVTVPVVLEYMEPSLDTVAIGSSQVALSSQGSVSIDAMLVNAVSGMSLPLQYDTLRVIIDSVVFDNNLPDFIEGTFEDIRSEEVCVVRFSSSVPDSALAIGGVSLATVHFTSTDIPGQFSLTPPMTESMAPYFVRPDGQYLSPVVESGVIEIGSVTDVDDADSPALPDRVDLAQNYPNPFNGETVIDLSLPARTDVTLELYNILGQRVRTLVDEPLGAGEHRLTWDGAYESGRQAPSGIYFYRLQAGEVTLVRKMILIK